MYAHWYIHMIKTTHPLWCMHIGVYTRYKQPILFDVCTLVYTHDKNNSSSLMYAHWYIHMIKTTHPLWCMHIGVYTSVSCVHTNVHTSKRMSCFYHVYIPMCIHQRGWVVFILCTHQCSYIKEDELFLSCVYTNVHTSKKMSCFYLVYTPMCIHQRGWVVFIMCIYQCAYIIEEELFLSCVWCIHKIKTTHLLWCMHIGVYTW
jgi:hypothetical protein